MPTTPLKTMARATSNAKAVGLKYGFRSGLEEQVAKQLSSQRVEFTYESHVIRYVKPERGAKYTPDFVLHNGIVVETKGRFVTADRQKHILLKEQHPGLDVRFVFSNPHARISKTSKTTYAMWCKKHGFHYAKQYIPQDWIDQPPMAARWAAVNNAGIKA